MGAVRFTNPVHPVFPLSCISCISWFQFCETNPNDNSQTSQLQVLVKNNPLQDDETNPNDPQTPWVACSRSSGVARLARMLAGNPTKPKPLLHYSNFPASTPPLRASSRRFRSLRPNPARSDYFCHTPGWHGSPSARRSTLHARRITHYALRITIPRISRVHRTLHHQSSPTGQTQSNPVKVNPSRKTSDSVQVVLAKIDQGRVVIIRTGPPDSGPIRLNPTTFVTPGERGRNGSLIRVNRCPYVADFPPHPILRNEPK